MKIQWIVIVIAAMLVGTVRCKKEGETHGKGGHEHTDGAPHWMAPRAEAMKKNPIEATAASVAAGKKIYQAKCTVCHGVHGDGKGPAAKGLKPPPADYTDGKMMGMHLDGDLFWKIGAGKGPMPGFAKTLRDTDRWNLVNYLRTFSKSGAHGRTDPKEQKHGDAGHSH